MARQYRQNARYSEIVSDGNESSEVEEKGENHGNTRLPFGLCARYGILLPKNATPRDAWDALKGKGITPEQVYDGLRVKDFRSQQSDVARIENDTIRESIEANNVEYKHVKKLPQKLQEDAIITRVAGGDLTKGSCSSVALAYIGNKAGFDVLDFRGGKSCYVFSVTKTILEIAKLDGVESYTGEGFSDFSIANELLTKVQEGKEYYFAVGKHAAIIRKKGDQYEYLELQSAIENGFRQLTTERLKKRFGCQKIHTLASFKLLAYGTLIECKSLGRNKDFQSMLGYINTEHNKQKKGADGHEK